LTSVFVKASSVVEALFDRRERGRDIAVELNLEAIATLELSLLDIVASADFTVLSTTTGVGVDNSVFIVVLPLTPLMDLRNTCGAVNTLVGPIRE
jgi:hypothetical protein